MTVAVGHPLSWPDGVARTAAPIQGRSRLRTTAAAAQVVDALNDLAALTGITANDIRLCSNKGSLRSRPRDGAAAAWFSWDDAVRCVASDLYVAPTDNFVAIAILVRACEAEHDRSGIAGVRQSLSKFALRTERTFVSSNDWHEILGIDATATRFEIVTAFRRLALTSHPDQGGERHEWDRLLNAYREGRRASLYRE